MANEDSLNDDLADDDDGSGAAAGVEEEPELYFAELEPFVDWLLDTYRRGTIGPQRTWCPEWWKHPEALARLDALWRAFEYLRLDSALGMSSWWRDHVDHHMPVLMDPDGPFKGCNAKDGHGQRPLEPLPRVAPPPGLLDYDQPDDDPADAGDDSAGWADTPRNGGGGVSRASELRVDRGRGQAYRRRQL